MGSAPPDPAGDPDAAAMATALDALSAQVVLLDGHGRVLRANAAAARADAPVAEVTPGDDYAARHAAAGRDPATTVALAAAIREACGGRGGASTFVYAWPTPGDGRWFLATLTPLPGPGPACVVVTHEEVTERKRAEAALRGSEAMWQTIVTSAPDIIFTLDREGRFRFINRTISGVDRHAVIGKTVYDFTPPESQAEMRARVARVFATGEPESYEMAGPGPEGTVAWYRSRVSPVRTERDLEALCFIVTDITDRRRAEEALRRQEEELRRHRDRLEDLVAERTADLRETNARLEREVEDRRRAETALAERGAQFRMLAEASPAAIMISRGRSVLYANEGCVRMLGYTVAELEARPMLELIRPDFREQVRTLALARLAGGAAPAHYEIPVIRKDGVERWIEVFAGLVEFQGAPATLTITFDVTDRRLAEDERRRMEGQLRDAQKLESLGVLAGGIAHDFNNLLVSMLGNASLALEEMRAGAPARPLVAEIERAALRAAELTHQMLAYAGRGTLAKQAVDVSALVREMATLLKSVVSKRALLAWDCPEGLPPIEADPAQLRQIVMNCITNASDALEGRTGEIAIRTGRLAADRETLAACILGEGLPAGPYVFVEVRDTGCGMTPETTARMFDPFFTTKFTGRGLGLAAVLGIVRGHRGAIRVETAPGRGTTFVVFFPAAPGATTPRVAAPEAADAWRGSGQVLVVDDEPGVRQVAKAMLERRGFRVLAAADGREGLALLTAHGADVVAAVLDVTMPIMSGDEVLAAMRQVRPGLPVVVSSGFARPESGREVAEAPGTAFLKKPYTTTELMDRLRRVLGR